MVFIFHRMKMIGRELKKIFFKKDHRRMEKLKEDGMKTKFCELCNSLNKTVINRVVYSYSLVTYRESFGFSGLFIILNQFLQQSSQSVFHFELFVWICDWLINN